ncbi:hypothetical protein, partial [Parabacteroides merdae]
TIFAFALTKTLTLSVILSNFKIFFIMEQTVNAQNFIQVVYSDRQKQSDICGKWFSPKESGSQLIHKAEKYLEAYKKYIEYLEAVVKLNPNDLDLELNLSKFDKVLSNATPAVRDALLAKYRNE